MLCLGDFDWLLMLLLLFTTSQENLATTTEKPCTDQYKDSRDICDVESMGGSVGLASTPFVLSTPADPAVDCAQYRTGVSCIAYLYAQAGQKILVSTGSVYSLADLNCDDCHNCDSFTVNDQCVKASEPVNQVVAVLNTTQVSINFTSYNINHRGETQAQMKVSAIGCAHKDLVQLLDRDIQITSPNGSSYIADTTVYTVNVSCDYGVLPNQEAWMLVECWRVERNGSHQYQWMNESKLSCAMSKSTTAAIVSVVLLIIVVSIIIIVLACLRCFPCQRNEGRNKKQLPVSESDEELREMTSKNGDANTSASTGQ